MDFLDHASETEQQFSDMTIQAVRDQAKQRLPFTGFCRYCEDVIPEPQIFCGPECRDDWEHQKKMEALNGRR